MADWYNNREGQPNEGWLCPSTQLREVGQRITLSQEDPTFEFVGALDQPWSHFESAAHTPPGWVDSLGRPPRWHIGSYGWNFWVRWPHNRDAPPTTDVPPIGFSNENQIQQPALTPFIADPNAERFAPEAS